MSSDKKVTDNKDILQQSTQTDETRRKLAKAGLASVPVILSLSSRPVWANHCSISGMQSGNASPKTHDTICAGCTPGYWLAVTKIWPQLVGAEFLNFTGLTLFAGDCVQKDKDDNNKYTGCHCQFHEYEDNGTKFHDIFAGALFLNPATMMSYTLSQVINLTGVDDPHQLGQHTVAALLNALIFENDPSYDYGLTPSQVVNLYNNNWMSNPEGLKNTFAMLNEVGCPLSGNCNQFG